MSDVKKFIKVLPAKVELNVTWYAGVLGAISLKKPTTYQLKEVSFEVK